MEALMGWLYFHVEPGVSTYDALARDFAESFKKVEPGAHATTSGAFYAVMTFEPDETSDYMRQVYEPCADGKYRYLLVCLIDRKSKDFYNFGYKDMDELMGPVADDCPVRLLDMLSPLTNRMDDDGPTQWARNFRERCRRHVEVRRERKLMLQPGAVIATEKPIRWTDGHESSRYRVESHRVRGNKRETAVLRSLEGGGLYRIPRNLMDYGPQTIEVL
jgi:hypothetical protein